MNIKCRIMMLYAFDWRVAGLSVIAMQITANLLYTINTLGCDVYFNCQPNMVKVFLYMFRAWLNHFTFSCTQRTGEVFPSNRNRGNISNVHFLVISVCKGGVLWCLYSLRAKSM